MKAAFLAMAAALLLSGVAHAAPQAGCEAQAAEKNLAGAAKNSFLKKCQRDVAETAKAHCTQQAADKKLSGAAKNSFVKKCEKEASSAASVKPQ